MEDKTHGERLATDHHNRERSRGRGTVEVFPGMRNNVANRLPATGLGMQWILREPTSTAEATPGAAFYDLLLASLNALWDWSKDESVFLITEEALEPVRKHFCI